MNKGVEAAIEFEFYFNRSLPFIGVLLLVSATTGLMRIFNSPFPDFALLLLYTTITMLQAATMLRKYDPFTTSEIVSFTLLYTHPINSLIGICVGIFTSNYIASGLSFIWLFIGFPALQHFSAALTMMLYSPKKKVSPMLQSLIP
ncbi:MAG: hypothetical protein QW035_01915 [Candidatus Anstonellales archaeon]